MDLTLDARRGDAGHRPERRRQVEPAAPRRRAASAAWRKVEAARCALADERPALDPELPLAKALAFWAPTKDDVPAALAATGLERLADVPVRLLSTGQLRRASLARVSGAPCGCWTSRPTASTSTALDLLGA
jgi:heme exporter protein A